MRSVIERPWLWNLVCLALLGVSGYLARNVRFDSDLRAFFGQESEAKAFLDAHQAVFPSDETVALIMLTPRDARADEAGFMRVLHALAKELSALQEIVQVQSAASAPVLVSKGQDLLAMPAFGPESELSLGYDERVKLLRRTGLGERLVSADGKHFGLLVWLRPEDIPVDRLRAPLALVTDTVARAVRKSPSPIEVQHAGVPYTRVAAIDGMQRDMLVLTTPMFLVVAGLLYFLFRRLHAVVLPLAVVGLSTVVTLGLVGARGQHLNMLTSVLPTLLLAIGVADSVHMLCRFYEERRAGHPPRRAAMIAGKAIGAACLFASLTTAVGFASLLTTKLPILRDFGLTAAFGVLCVFALMLPLVCVHMAARSSAPPPEPLWPLRKPVVELTRRLLQPKAARTAVLLSLVLMVGAGYLGSKAVINNYLSTLLPSNHPVFKANRTIDEKLGGVIPIDIAFVGEPGSMRKPEVLALQARAGRELREELGLSGVLGIAPLLEELHEQFVGERKIPESAAGVADLWLMLESASAVPLDTLTSSDDSRTRFVAAIPDLGAVDFERLRVRIDAHLQELFEGTAITARVTGVGTVAYSSINGLASELVYGELLAACVIVLMIGLTLRNARLVLVSIVPNLLPLLLGLAWFGASGAFLDPAPAMVFTIVSGIVVDDTVHILARYKEELAQGRNQTDAILVAVGEVGGAAVSTGLVLILAFLLIACSAFPSTRMFGLLGASILALGLPIDLVLLPALLYVFDRRARPVEQVSARPVGTA